MAKFPFKKVEPAAPKDIAVPASAPTTSAELTALIVAWRLRVDAITPEIVTLERAGTRPPDKYSAVGGEALRLFEGQPLAEAVIDTPSARLAALHRERDVLNATIALGEARMVKFLSREAALRFESFKPELDAAMRKAALAVAALERALQERDVVLAKINSIGPIQEYCGWLLCGRLEVQGFTQTSRFLNYAQTRGWISQAELDAELSRVQQRKR